MPPGPPPGGFGPVPPNWQQPQPLPGPAGYPAPGYPGYPPPGYPAPGYPFPGYQAGPPPGSARKTLLVISALFLTAAVVAGGLAVWLFLSVVKAAPPITAQFASEGRTSVNFAAGETKVIYAKSDEQRHHIQCRVKSTMGVDGLRVENINDGLTLSGWQAALSVTAQQPGTYTVTCLGAPNDTFGIGGPASTGRMGTSVLLGLFAAALGLVALVTGLIGLIQHRRRPG